MLGEKSLKRTFLQDEPRILYCSNVSYLALAMLKLASITDAKITKLPFAMLVLTSAS